LNGLDDVVRLRGQSAEERMRGRETYIFERLDCGRGASSKLSLRSQRIPHKGKVVGTRPGFRNFRSIFLKKNIFYLTQPGTGTTY
jgi:hypothetical protein